MSLADANTKIRSSQDCEHSSFSIRWNFDFLNKSQFFLVNKYNNTECELTERRRDSSIKKILSNQPLEKQEYVGKHGTRSIVLMFYFLIIELILTEINQKVQNSSISASKVHSSNDLNGLERSNSAGSRESTCRSQRIDYSL